MGKEDDARKLKDEALKAVEKGKWKKALQSYLKLELLERTNGSWPHKAGDMHRREGDKADAIGAYLRAAEVYSGTGFLLKAVAVCKIVLELDPTHGATLERLASLHATRTDASGAAGMGRAAAAAMNQLTMSNPGFGPGSASGRIPMMSNTDAQAVVQSMTVAGKAGIAGAPRSETGTFEVTDVDVVMEKPAETAGVPAKAPRTPTGSFEITDVDIDVEVEAPVPPPPPPPKRRTLPPGMSIDQVSLARAIPESRQSKQFAAVNVNDIMEIPIDVEEPPAAAADPAAEAALALLPRTPLFSALDETSLNILLHGVRLVELAAGQVLFHQGDPADALYVIAEGEVAVLTGADNTEVARLGEGAFFGEIALLTQQPRNATIQAREDATLLAIDRDTISRVVSDSPDVLKILLRFLRDRLLDTLVGTNPLFAPFSGPERRQLARRFTLLEAESGAEIVRQGLPTAGLFIILCGQAEVLRDDAPLAHLGAGDIFGEVSLLDGSPATAAVRARSRLYLLQLDRRTFSEVIMTHPQVLEFTSGLAEGRRPASPAAVAAVFEDGHLRLL